MTMNLKWVSWLLCGMGVLFLCIGVGVCYLAWRSGDLSPEESGAFYISMLGVFGLFGIIMFTIGAVMGGRMSKKARLKKRLLDDGNYVWAEIVEISQNYSVQINGRSPYVVRCKHRHSDGETYLFKSPYLRYNPQSLFPDGRVKVWFDRDNIKNYYVDIEENPDGGFIEV